MDPRAILEDAMQALVDDDDLDSAADSLILYHAWRSRGGFEPTLGDTPGDLLASQILRTIEVTARCQARATHAD